MPRVRLIGIEEAEGKARELFDEIERTRGKGRVTHLWRAMAHNPEVGYYFWRIHKALMAEEEKESRLDKKLREKIALIVSLANECKYCLAFHSSTLDRVGLSKDEIKKYIRFEQGEEVDIPLEEKKLLSFIKKASIDPHRITDRELEEVKSLGYDERDIVEMMQIVMLFTGISRFVGVFQIGAVAEEMEPWIQPYADLVEMKKWSW